MLGVRAYFPSVAASSCTTAYLRCVRCPFLWFQQGGKGEELQWMVTGLCPGPASHHGRYRKHSVLTGKRTSLYWPRTFLFNRANANYFHLKNINTWESPEITMVTYSEVIYISCITIETVRKMEIPVIYLRVLPWQEYNVCFSWNTFFGYSDCQKVTHYLKLSKRCQILVGC